MATFLAKRVSGPTPEEICRDVKAGNIKPVYYLMGEESYYIDRVADFIVDCLLKPEERDFNLMTFFGVDADINSVILAAKGFPMGAQYQVVVVKEAQNIRDIDRLEFYLRQPQSTTVIVFCHKNGVLDRRKKIAGLIEKSGVLFDSKKMKEAALPTFIRNYLRKRQLTIDPAATALLAEYVGSDLNRMAGELDKLCIAKAQGEKNITSGLIERHIGISKDFNIFELQDALGQKDVLKVIRIANYFDKNSKENPPQKILPALFRYFTNVMLAYYSPDKTERGIAVWLGVNEWQVRKNVMPAMRYYSGVKVMKIIGEIRRTDARLKGVGTPGIPGNELMKELYYFILH